nr:unnamed protein product [Digitaria exilis]
MLAGAEGSIPCSGVEAPQDLMPISSLPKLRCRRLNLRRAMPLEVVRHLFINENSNMSMMTDSEQCLHEAVAKRRKVAEISLCDLPMCLELWSVSLQLPSDYKGFLNLKSLTLVDRTIVPERPFKFTYLRNLRLELIILGKEIRTTDVLDYAHLLKIAPFMETMELIMFMSCRHRPYCKADGELRIGLPHQHTHLKNVRISGFFGHKEQVELALHILRSSIVLKKMDVTPKLEITRIASRDSLSISSITGMAIGLPLNLSAKQTITMW